MSDQSKYKKYIKTFWKLFFSGVLFFYFLLFLISLGALGKMPNFKELENPKFDLASEVYAEEGELLGKYYISNRTYINADELPQHLIDALIATEDVRYYNHSGIDAKGTIRAVVFLGKRGGASTISQQLAKMLFHKSNRSVLHRIKQKLQEWVIAAQLERRYTKEEVIAMYFNQFDFTYNAVGIHSAADIYFNKSPKKLNLEESAMFVAMAKNPSLYNPIRMPENAFNRRNTVLNQMVKYNYLNKHICDSLKQLPIKLNYQKINHYTGTATYFRQVLQQEIKRILNEKNPNTDEYLISKPDGTKYNLFTDGLKIYTTINYDMQTHAEWAVKKYLGGSLQKHFSNDVKKRNYPPFHDKMSKNTIENKLWGEIRKSQRYKRMTNNGKKRINKSTIWKEFKKPYEMIIFTWQGEKKVTMSPLDSIKYYKSILHTGLISMVPESGHVKAWVGGINNKYFQLDHVIQSKRQVGSTFKPILYTTAFEEMGDEIHPCMEIANMPYYFNKGELGLMEKWQPEYGPEFNGKVNLKFGLANSMNNIAVYLMKKVKPAPVVAQAKAMGITSPLDTVASLCLGVSDISLYEMVGAYACIANNGIWRKPIFISKIEDKNGNVIKVFESEAREALSEKTAYIMQSMMKGVVDGVYNDYYKKKRGTGMSVRSIYKIDYPLAGKTGTTQNNTDGWYIGYNPAIVTGVWVGADDPSVRFKSRYFGQGAVMALPIWALYMRKVFNDEKIGIDTSDFSIPNSIKNEIDCDNYSSTLDEDYNFYDDDDQFGGK